MHTKILFGNKIKLWVNSLSFLFDKEYVVIIKRYHKKRSNDVNELYWAWITGLANYIGYTPQELHEAYKRKFIKWEKVDIPEAEYYKPGSTKTLKTDEFWKYLNLIHQHAIQFHGFILPYPDDPDFSLFMERYKDLKVGECYA